MGFWKSKGTKTNLNQQMWHELLYSNDTSVELKELIEEFLIPDNIDINKFLENQKANHLVNSHISLETWEMANSLSMTTEQRNQRINCTPTFRKHFSDNLLTRALGFPEWFYVAYPDVAIWVLNDDGTLEKELSPRESEFMVNEEEVSNRLFRFLINKYKREKTPKLECSL